MSSLGPEHFLEIEKGAINFARQLSFGDAALRLFEQDKSGGQPLLTLTADWMMRRKPDDKNFPEHPFEGMVIDSEVLTTAIKRKAAFAMIGMQKFKLKPPQSSLGNWGIWKFRAQAI